MNIFRIKNLSLYGSLLSCFILFAGISLKGQIHFERVSPPLPAPQNTLDFLPVIDGHNSAGDIDNDGDLDVVITGSYDSRGIAKLYLNDGLGNYSETDSDLEGVLLSYSRFGDIDNDGDLDLIISGEDSTYTPTTKLYLNNGSGEFSLDTVSVFHGLVDGLLTLGDVDNDGDLDLMTYGYELNFVRRTRLYLNDGTGIFFVGREYEF